MQRILAALAALFLGLAQPAQAQDFPNRTINMIVVFAPGGATDVLARIVADHMMKTLGQRVTVENISGAGGTIGGARGAQAAPDGYTLTVGSLGSHSAAPSIYRSIQYDPRELQPIGLIAGACPGQSGQGDECQCGHRFHQPSGLFAVFLSDPGADE
jgi:tripartite-type tricarboxylate transporter receptor subunit TctC